MANLKEQLAALRAKQKAKQAERAANPRTPAKPVEKSTARKGPSEAEMRAAELQKQMDELRAQQVAFLEQQRAALAASQREEVVGYLTRAGARVNPSLLAQVAPAVDPRTAEGRKALEEFRSAHADIFAPAARPAGDVTAGVVERIDKTAKGKGQKGVEGRKVFDQELVRKTIAKNLGGEPV
jgi:ribosomal protein L29